MLRDWGFRGREFSHAVKNIAAAGGAAMRLPDHWATDLRSAPAYGERNTNFRAIPTVSLGPGADFREESVAHLISTELGG